MRSGCTVHLKNGKTFERNGCIVNKGHTKTTYEVRTRKKKVEKSGKASEYVKMLINGEY